MKLSAVRGVIDRRILINYRIDPERLARQLPAPFRPKCVGGHGIGGICLIRTKALRPRFLPGPLGTSSENAALRFAVEWDAGDRTFEGVFVPRRFTDSLLNRIVGGWLFPGLQEPATFGVRETASAYSVSVRSRLDDFHLAVDGILAGRLDPASAFSSLADASAFFRAGAVGHSTKRHDPRADEFGLRGLHAYDSLELRCDSWDMLPLRLTRLESSYFEDPSRYPGDSAVFDSALLMQSIAHSWHADPCARPLGRATFAPA